MRDGWEIKKLGDIAESRIGLTYKPENVSETGTIVLRSGNIQNSALSFDDIVRVQCNIKESLFVQENDILMCSRNGSANLVGKVALIKDIKEPMSYGAFMTIIRSKYQNYLFAFFKSPAFRQQLTSAKTATINQITVKMLNDVEIPVPPISEQERIVEELDLLSGIIEKKRQQLKELDNLAQSIFYDIFGDPITNEKGWDIFAIDNVCSSIVRGPFGSTLKKDFFVEPSNNTYKVYEQKHAIQKSATIGTYYISCDMFKTLSRFEVKSGDIIMSCSGTIGEFYEIPNGAERGIMNQALLKFTLNSLIHKSYFLYTMEWVKENFEKKGSGLQNIGSVKTIKETSISIPPLSLQQEFAKRIEAIGKQKELIKQSLAETETLFSSRMDYYFN